MKKLFLAALIMGAAAATAMDDSGWATQFESMSAFDSQYGNRSGYVKPIIDNLGNVLNSNWYASASVPQSFTFEAGLPISIIPIGDDDKSYDGKPTIFGDHGNPEAPSDTIYGIKTLNGLGVFTYPYLQMGASFYHFRAVLRMMYLPSISDLRKFSLFGIGFQYSFGHFFQYMLPKAAQPFDVSIVYGYNSSSIGYRPDEFDGKLGLDVSTHNFSFVFGYKPVNFFEVMMSLGYQSAEMLSYGELYQIDPYTNFRKNEIYPDITVKGNNGFRFGIAIALQINSFHPVLGYDYAGKSSFTTNVLYFKSQFGKDKTPDEIAKEKGYVRSGSVSNDEEDTEETPKASKKKKSKKKKKVVEEEPEEDDAAGDTTATDDEFEEFDEE